MSLPKRTMGLWSGLDKTILAIIFCLMSVGIVMSFAASPLEAPSSNPWHYVQRQIAFSVIGLAALFISAALSPIGIRRMAGLVLLGSLVAMVAVLIIGLEAKGGQRWLRFGSLSLQPSEFFKPAFIVFVAWLFCEEDKGAPIPGRGIALGIYAVSVLLLIRQPDFGQTVLVTMIFGAMLWVSGLTWRTTAILSGLAGLGGFVAYSLLPHVRDRVAQFIAPASDPLARNQTDFAIDAIRSGGFWGAGPGEGLVKNNLPEPHTDFVFSVAAEELGLLGSLAIITLYALLFTRSWALALRMTDPFHQLATAGLSLLFGIQALVNIAVNLDIAPPTGMTLPFISYGGSSILALALSAGLLLALTKRRPGAYAPARQSVTTVST